MGRCSNQRRSPGVRIRNLKKLVLILSTLLICSYAHAGINAIEEEDGSPSVFPWKIKVTNGTLTNNNDGTASLTTGGGGGGSSTVNTSDIATVPYYVSRTNITGDVNNLWDSINNTHIISEDAGQLGSVLAFSVNNKNGFSVANISHDGSGAFKKLNLSEDLAVVDGGTGASSFTTNGVMLGNGTSALNVTTADTATNHFLGSTATSPAFRQIMAQDIAFAGNANALTYYPTATTLGTLTADTTAGHVLVSTTTLPNFRQLLTSDVSGTHSLAQGGTGITSGTANALTYFPNTGVMGSLTADTTAGHALFSTTTLPSFRGIISPDIVAGSFGVERGGTGQSSTTKGDILVGGATTGWFKFPVGTDGTVLSADSSQPQGVKWVAPSAGGGSVTGSGADGQVTYWTSGTAISGNPSLLFTYSGPSNTLSISRDAAQRGNLINLSSDVGAMMTYVSYDGSIAINTNSPQLQGKLNVSSDSTTTIPIRVRQPASSTVNAQTWESGTGTTQAAISSDGSGQFGGTIAVLPTDGSFGYDGTTQKAFHYGAAGMSQDLVGVILTSTANVANINRTTNVSMIDLISGDVGTNVLPANFWTPGKTVRVKSMGKFRTTANPTMNFSLNLGGRTLVTTSAINMPSTVNSKYWIVEGYLQCRQTGGAGRVMAWATLTRQGSTNVSTDSIGMMSSDAAIINTTLAASIDIVTAWGTANALNVISSDISIIEVLR